MAEKVDAWMPLHIGAYIAATRHLSTSEHGMYLLLMMHAWNNGGVIPGEDERLQRICGATPREWKASRATILAFLTKQPDGTYRQNRLDAEFSKAIALKSERSEAGSKGAANRWQRHGKAMAEPIANAMANEWPIPEPSPEPTTTPPSPPRGGVAVDNSTPKRNGNGRWWLSQDGIIAEGRRRGVQPKSGESYSQYAERIRQAPKPKPQEARP